MKDKGWLLFFGVVAFLVIAGGGGTAVMNYAGILTPKQIYDLATGAGFAGVDAVVATAIALAESGGNPQAHGDKTKGSGRGSFGLWQIYSDAHPEFGPDFTLLFDPKRNAAAAFSVYRDAGSSFTPWTTYNSGAFEAFYERAATDSEG